MHTCRMLGIIYWDFKQCDSALMYDTVWLNYYEKSGNLDYYAMALSETGEDYQCLNDTLALPYMIKALDLAFLISDSDKIGHYCGNLGSLYLDSAKSFYDPRKAEFYLIQSGYYLKKSKLYSIAAEMLTNLAKFYV